MLRWLRLHLKLRKDHAWHADGCLASQHSVRIRVRVDQWSWQGQRPREGTSVRSGRRDGRSRRQKVQRRSSRENRALRLPDRRLLCVAVIQGTRLWSANPPCDYFWKPPDLGYPLNDKLNEL